MAGTSGSADSEGCVGDLATALGLTEEQAAAMVEAHQTFHAALAHLFERARAGDLTRDEARELAGDLHAEFDARDVFQEHDAGAAAGARAGAPWPPCSCPSSLTTWPRS